MQNNGSEIALNLLKDNIKKSNAFNNKVSVDFKSRPASDNNKKLIKNVNNQVLINVLSPEIKANENIKRALKVILVSFLILFLLFQFCTVFSLTSSVLNFSFKENSNIETIKILLTFVSAYITSVVIELIAILKYIVKNVFDTSIAELVKIFKENENSTDELKYKNKRHYASKSASDNQNKQQ